MNKCWVCGKEFKLKNGAIYCSQKCNSLNWYKKNKLNHNKRSKKNYEDNREKRIAKSKEYVKKVNYKYEKTPDQRRIRYIKRETRRLFPLKNKICALCGESATEHHHNTNPITIIDFIFICKPCHNKLHTKEVTSKNGNR